MIVVIKSTFVSDLISNELSVVSSRNSLVDELSLIRLPSQVGRDELCHLNIVGEDVERKMNTFCDGNKLVGLHVCFVCVIIHVQLCVSGGATIEAGKRLNKFVELQVILYGIDSETIRLFIEVVGIFNGEGS